MAERRMFAKSVIDSDAFLDMPLSAQALYFHFGMRADDDGFVNSPRKIQRLVGCGNDDLKLLIAKKFIIPFETGIVVIKHWKIHNYIQKDRYRPTVYQEEKSLLSTKSNKAYTLEKPVDTKCIHDGSNVDAQVRIGKVSIELGKSSLELEGEEEEPAPPLPAPPPENEKVNCQEVVDLYNTICTSLPSVRELSDARRKAITEMVRKYGLEKIVTVFQSAQASAFLKGKNERNWTANFNWLLEEENLVKVLEGNYADKPNVNKPSQRAIDAMNRLSAWAAEQEKTVGNDPELAERAEKLRQQLNGGQDLPDSEGAEV